MIFCVACLKGQNRQNIIALAYLTGILPIKKIKRHSPLSTIFEEFTMLDAGRMAPYVGFTEEEVHDYATGTDRSMSR